MTRPMLILCAFAIAASALASHADSRTLAGLTAPAVLGPRRVSGSFATFRFASHEPGVSAKAIRFRCAVDSTRLHACPSPYRVRLRAGRHLLRVRAVDPRGRSSATTSVRIAVVLPPPPTPAVAVGGGPVNVASGAGSVWASNSNDGTISRIDAATAKVTATIAIGGSPTGIAFGDGSVWVGNFGNGDVSRVDPATNKVVARIALGGQPLGPTVADDGTVWVANFDGSVERIDPATDRVVARIDVGGQANLAAYGFGKVWVGNQNGTVTAIDPATNAVSGTPTAVAKDTDAIAISDRGVWVSTFYSGIVALIDPSSRAIVSRLRLPGHASGLLFAAGSLWASVYDQSEVVRIDPATAKILRAVKVGAAPRDLTFAAGSIWVVDEISDAVSHFAP